MRWFGLGERNMGMKHVLLAISIWTKPLGKLFLLILNNVIGSALVLLISFVPLMQASETKDWQHLMETGFGEGMHQASQCSFPGYLNWVCWQNWNAKKKYIKKIAKWPRIKKIPSINISLACKIHLWELPHTQSAGLFHTSPNGMSSKQMLHDFFFHTSQIFSLHTHVLQQISPQILFGSDNMSQELKPEMLLWQQSAALIICWSDDMNRDVVNKTVSRLCWHNILRDWQMACFSLVFGYLI